MKLTALITNILVLSLLSYFPISLNRIQYQTNIKDFAKVEKNQAQVIHIETVLRMMKYSLDKFDVKAEKYVEILFTNKDEMRHNLLIISPGSLEIVGQAADRKATTPKGVEKQWTPEIPEVLFTAPLIKLNETNKLVFIAPENPGYYPFTFTFPIHWRNMNGTMIVK
jgi:hypothetical protein